MVCAQFFHNKHKVPSGPPSHAIVCQLAVLEGTSQLVAQPLEPLRVIQVGSSAACALASRWSCM